MSDQSGSVTRKGFYGFVNAIHSALAGASDGVARVRHRIVNSLHKGQNKYKVNTETACVVRVKKMLGLPLCISKVG